jgi:hypothetical protein
VARVANWAGQSSRYVLNPDSAWGLSFDTRGRESERRIPSMSYKSVIVPAVICAPRSEWMISWPRSTCSRLMVTVINHSAISAVSTMSTHQPTVLRDHRSQTAYR